MNMGGEREGRPMTNIGQKWWWWVVVLWLHGTEEREEKKTNIIWSKAKLLYTYYYIVPNIGVAFTILQPKGLNQGYYIDQDHELYI